MEPSSAVQGLDPLQLARDQLRRDYARVRLIPGLLAHKIARMQLSPSAFLRGSAPLFYEVLKARPSLGAGPAGEGWIAGDLHLENFGAFRTDSESVAFNVNDFDDAILGPWRLDILRLMTSLILRSRDLGIPGTRVLALCGSLLDAYQLGVREGHPPGRPPPLIARLLYRATRRTRQQLLNARTQVVKGSRRFIRGDRYKSLPRRLRSQAQEAFARYACSLEGAVEASREAFEILDVAFRVAGVGSLGKLRIAVLVKGGGGKHRAWLFDMKEQGIPSPATVLGPPKIEPAIRVVTAQRACLERAPLMLGTTQIGHRSLSVRRLAPQEDKLNLRDASPEELEGVVRYVGAIAGRVHWRGAAAAARPWTRHQREHLIDRAVTLAGLHEAIYLCFCRLTGSKARRPRG